MLDGLFPDKCVQLAEMRRALQDDPLNASLFVANLGSVGLDAPYHHLYEYGNCPLFATVGQLKPGLFAAPDGAVVSRPALVLRYSYDERVEDGFYAAQAIGLEHAPVYIVSSIDPIAEMRFNQLHNGTDLDTGDEHVTVPPRKGLGYHDVPAAAIAVIATKSAVAAVL